MAPPRLNRNHGLQSRLGHAGHASEPTGTTRVVPNVTQVQSSTRGLHLGFDEQPEHPTLASEEALIE